MCCLLFSCNKISLFIFIKGSSSSLLIKGSADAWCQSSEHAGLGSLARPVVCMALCYWTERKTPLAGGEGGSPGGDALNLAAGYGGLPLLLVRIIITGAKEIAQ